MRPFIRGVAAVTAFQTVYPGSTGDAAFSTARRPSLRGPGVRPYINRPVAYTFVPGGPQTFTVDVTFTGLGSLALQRQINLFRDLAGLGTNSLQKQVNLFRAFSGLGTETLTQFTIRSVIVTFTGTGTLALQKQVNLFRTYTGTGTLALQKEIRKLLAYAGTGTVSFLKSTIYQVVKTFAGIGTLAFSGLFIPAGSGPVAGLSSAIRRLFRFARHH
jgi:hypothetical protein